MAILSFQNLIVVENGFGEWMALQHSFDLDFDEFVFELAQLVEMLVLSLLFVEFSWIHSNQHSSDPIFQPLFALILEFDLVMKLV